MRLGLLEQVYEIYYRGRTFSLNDLYSQSHWTKRSNLKNEFKGLFLEELQKSDTSFCHQFYLIIFYNTKHDPDNIVGMSKIFVDTMKGIYVPDDNKKYFKGLLIFPDASLPSGSVDFIIVKQK